MRFRFATFLVADIGRWFRIPGLAYERASAEHGGHYHVRGRHGKHEVEIRGPAIGVRVDGERLEQRDGVGIGEPSPQIVFETPSTAGEVGADVYAFAGVESSAEVADFPKPSTPCVFASSCP